jgi:hypothetical protein
VDAVCLPRFYQMTVRRVHPIKLNRFAKFLIKLSSRADHPVSGDIPFVFVLPREQLSSFRYAADVISLLPGLTVRLTVLCCGQKPTI